MNILKELIKNSKPNRISEPKFKVGDLILNKKFRVVYLVSRILPNMRYIDRFNKIRESKGYELRRLYSEQQSDRNKYCVKEKNHESIDFYYEKLDNLEVAQVLYNINLETVNILLKDSQRGGKYDRGKN